jgi:hypothetical protein
MPSNCSVRRGAFDADQPSDAMHQYPRFAAAGAGDHQHRAGWNRYRLALRIIERIE